jgi:hypothetical protein
MRKRRSTNNRPDHRGKKRYRGEKDIIHKKRKERKPEQRKDK